MDDIFNLKKKRNWKGAILFYVLYFILGLALVMVFNYLVGLVLGDKYNFDEAFDIGMRIGAFFAVVVVILLGWLMLKEKGLLKSGTAVFIVVLAVILSAVSGFLGGLIPLAYLSTRGKSEVQKDEQINSDSSK